MYIDIHTYDCFFLPPASSALVMPPAKDAEQMAEKIAEKILAERGPSPIDGDGHRPFLNPKWMGSLK